MKRSDSEKTARDEWGRGMGAKTASTSPDVISENGESGFEEEVDGFEGTVWNWRGFVR